jgi:cobalt/nickel transport system permease protein
VTHMHVPDGILPLWLWVSGYLLTAVFLALSIYRLRAMDRRKNIPLLGAVAAAMLVAMSLEILPLAYHLNLSVAAGILLGPSLGFIASFIVNLMLALMGHGGITVVGLNTLLLGAEAVLGHTLFFLLPARMPVFWRAATATVTALCVASLLLIAIVAVSHVDVALVQEAQEPSLFSAAGREGLRTFAIMVLSFGAIGWVLEAAITGAAIRFIARVKPDLLAHVLHRGACSRSASECRS